MKIGLILEIFQRARRAGRNQPARNDPLTGVGAVGADVGLASIDKRVAESEAPPRGGPRDPIRRVVGYRRDDRTTEIADHQFLMPGDLPVAVDVVPPAAEHVAQEIVDGVRVAALALAVQIDVSALARDPALVLLERRLVPGGGHADVDLAHLARAVGEIRAGNLVQKPLQIGDCGRLHRRWLLGSRHLISGRAVVCERQFIGAERNGEKSDRRRQAPRNRPCSSKMHHFRTSISRFSSPFVDLPSSRVPHPPSPRLRRTCPR